jgi:hypothetical protein
VTNSSPDIFEPHHLIFSYCDAHFGKVITRDLHEVPVQIRLKFFRKLAKERSPTLIQRADLLAYLEKISSCLSDKLKDRSPYFWLFLYRRIKPVLSPRHDNLTDSRTTLLVRQIVELAIYKFGALDRFEFAMRSKTDFSKQWGGQLKLIVDQVDGDRDAIISMLNSDAVPDTLIPIEFRPADYRNLYAAEGLAYEYWLCTARLRSIGKGCELWFDPESGQFTYKETSDVREAIKRFDNRLKGVTFFPTLVGIVTPDTPDDRIEQIFATSYNVDSIDLSDIFAAMGFPAKSRDGGNLSNFLPGFLSVDEFVRQHQYLADPFQKKTGFALEPFLYVLWAISSLALIPNSFFTSDISYGFLLFTLLRRGYSVYGTNSFPDAVRKRLLLHKRLDQSKRDEIDKIINAAVDYLTLSAEGRIKITPWSGGPRPILSCFENSWLIDTVGILEFITRMFTGVYDDGTARGLIFENTVRLAAEKIRDEAGIEFGPRKISADGRLIDEIDLMVKKRKSVFVCECFSMWMPLDFEIGNNRTIDARTAQIDKKLDQAAETCRYLEAHPAGSNYDFKGIETFVPIVVSPFIEWLPSTSTKYWLPTGQPRVMSVDELIEFLRSE